MSSYGMGTSFVSRRMENTLLNDRSAAPGWSTEYASQSFALSSNPFSSFENTLLKPLSASPEAQSQRSGFAQPWEPFVFRSPLLVNRLLSRECEDLEENGADDLACTSRQVSSFSMASAMSLQMHDDVREISEFSLAPSLSLRSDSPIPTFTCDAAQTSSEQVEEPMSVASDDSAISDLVEVVEPVAHSAAIRLNVEYTKPELPVVAPEIVDEDDVDEDLWEKAQLKGQSKLDLLNHLCAALIGSPDYKNPEDAKVKKFVELLRRVSLIDPEFIVKSAIYGRLNLNLRTPANFLLAYAAMVPHCRPFLKKYFGKTIRLPTDWMEVPELLATMTMAKANGRHTLPYALRVAMSNKFGDFDEYQLAKHNKNKKTNKKKKKLEKESAGGKKGRGGKTFAGKQSQRKAIPPRPPALYNLKKLIKQLHVTKPASLVMKILGKKYPTDPVAFARTGLLGVWEEERAGKRMKLATPETWETQISLRGNRADVWTSLIKNKKLPYMAMLRNLRNILKSGVKQEVHSDVLKRLADERQVINSRQFPFRFFSAYHVLDETAKNRKAHAELAKALASSKVKVGKKTGKQRDDAIKALIRNRKILQKSKQFANAFTDADIEKYKAALDKAVKIATLHNVPRIPGKTLIFVDLTETATTTACTSARGLGPPKTAAEMGALMGLMAKSACEDAHMYGIYGGNVQTAELNLKPGTILANMELVMAEAARHKKQCTGKDLALFVTSAVQENSIARRKIDNVILLTSMPSTFTSDLGAALARYRQVVNERLLYVTVELTGSKAGTTPSSEFGTHNDRNVFLTGYSDQILRFIGERGSEAQLLTVDRIDRAYDLDQLDVKANHDVDVQERLRSVDLSSIPTHLATKRQEIRVFVSSTFKDMHAERDTIMRYVYPELRRRARDCFQKDLILVDMRWGITAEQYGNVGLQLCLKQASESDLFIGFVGRRYGYVPPGHDDQLSVTHLECRAFKEAHTKKYGRTNKGLDKRMVVFVRDDEWMGDVPKHVLSDVANPSEASLVKSWRSELTQWGVTQQYRCTFLGVRESDGVPLAGNLSGMAQRALEWCWDGTVDVELESASTISASSPLAISHKSVAQQETEIWAQVASLAKGIVGYAKSIESVKQSVKRGSEGLTAYVQGPVGEGKTGFLAKLAMDFLKTMKRSLVVPCFKDILGVWPLEVWILNLIQWCNSGQNIDSKFSLKPDTTGGQPIQKAIADGLESLAKRTRVVILFDGYGEEEMTGLADVVRMNVCTIATCVTAPQQQSSMAGGSNQHLALTLESLTVQERQALVEGQLARFGKTLDGNAFSNQMRLLLTKRGASSPLFLTLATEMMVRYGTFENLTAYIRSIPSSIPGVVQSMISSLEADHGREVVSAVVGVMAAAGCDGLPSSLWYAAANIALDLLGDERAATLVKRRKGQPLSQLFDHAMVTSAGKEEVNLAGGTFVVVANGLEPVLEKRDGSDLQAFRSDLVVNVAQKMYKESNIYKVAVAAAILQTCDPVGDGTFTGTSDFACQKLLDTLTSVNADTHLATCLTRISCLYAILVRGGPAVDGLPAAYTRAIANAANAEGEGQTRREVRSTVPAAKRLRLGKDHKGQEDEKAENMVEKLKVYEAFVIVNREFLRRYPQLIIQCASNEPSTSLILHDPSLPVVQRACRVPVLLRRGPNDDYLGGGTPATKVMSAEAYATATIVSPDGLLTAVGYVDGRIGLYETASGKGMGELKGHGSKVNALVFLEQGALLVSGGDDKEVIVWNVATRSRHATFTGAHVNAISSAVVVDALPRGAGLMTGGWDGFFVQWDYRKKRQVQLKSTGCPISALAAHPTLPRLAVGSWDGTVKIFDLGADVGRKAILHGEGSVRAVKFSSCGKYLASAHTDGAVRMWSAEFGREIAHLSTPSNLPMQSLSYTPDHLCSASQDGALRLYSARLGRPMLIVKTGPEEPAMTGVSAQWNGVVMGRADGKLTGLDLEGNVRFELKPFDTIQHVTSLPDGCCLVAGRREAKVLTPSGTLKYDVELADGVVAAVASGEQHLAVGYTNGLIGLYDLTGVGKGSKPSLCEVYAHDGGTTDLSLSTEGHLASVGQDGFIRIWSLIDLIRNRDQAKPVRAEHARGTDRLNAVTWVDGGKKRDRGRVVATGGSDGTLTTWSFNTKNDELSVLRTVTDLGGAILKMGGMYSCFAVLMSTGKVHLMTWKTVLITSLDAAAADLALAWDSPRVDWAGEVEEETTGREVLDRMKGMILATAGFKGVTVWKPFEANHEATLPGHRGAILDVAAGPQALVSVGVDGSTRFWRSLPSNEDSQAKGHPPGRPPVTCVMLVGSGAKQLVLSGDCSGTLTAQSASAHSAKTTVPDSAPVTHLVGVSDDDVICGTERGNLHWIKLERESGGKESLSLKVTYSKELDNSPIVDFTVIPSSRTVTLTLANERQWAASVRALEQRGMDALEHTGFTVAYTSYNFGQVVRGLGLLTPGRFKAAFNSYFANLGTPDWEENPLRKKLATLAASESVCCAVSVAERQWHYVAETTGWINIFRPFEQGSEMEMELAGRFKAADGKITGLAAEPVSTLLYVASTDGVLKVWETGDAHNAKLVGVWEAPTSLTCVHVDGKSVVCGDSLGHVYRLDYKGTNDSHFGGP